MPQRVQFSDAIEPLVQFIEDTPPDEILDRTLDKLRGGVPTQTMLTASALAVTRSTDLPPGHHGGPLHPLVGLHAVSKLVGRLEGEERFRPGAAARGAVEQAHPPSGDGPIRSAGVRAGGCRRCRGDQGGLPRRRQSRREQQGGPSVPVAVGACAADRGVRPAAERGNPEKCRRRSLLRLSRLHLAGPRKRGDRLAVLLGSDAACGALCLALPDSPDDPRDRNADRGT